MKIAFISQPFDQVLPPRQNSIGHWIYEVARGLAGAHEVVVYTANDCDTPEVMLKNAPVQFVRIFMHPDALLHKILQYAMRFHNIRRTLFATFLFHLGYILQVAWKVRNRQCDIVHVFNFSQFVPIIRAFNPACRIVLHMQCEWLTQLKRAMIEPRLREADLIVGCSDYITKKIRQSFPQFSGRCQTIYNGVDIRHFVNGNGAARSNGRRRLLFVGRVSPEKGVHTLLEAFEKVIARYPDAHLEIIGPQGQLPQEYIVALSDDQKLSALAAFYNGKSCQTYSSGLKERLSSGLAKQVTFCQHIPHSSLVDHYRSADMLINPSFSESFGMALVEAMSCRVPVVATRVGGMPEIVKEGETGLLVESGDASALAAAIIDLLENRERREAMGNAGRERVQALFSWDQIVSKLSALYETILEKPQRGRAATKQEKNLSAELHRSHRVSPKENFFGESRCFQSLLAEKFFAFFTLISLFREYVRFSDKLKTGPFGQL